MKGESFFGTEEKSIPEKLVSVSWLLIFLLCLVAGVGFISLYSAAGGNLEPWAQRHIVRFIVGVGGLLLVAMIDVRTWMRLAYPLYALAFLLLIFVDIRGHIGMGAQRWIDLGFMQLQPSEVMKVVSVLALARFFHGASLEDVRRPLFLAVPLALVAAPVALVLWQPDLGTALTIVFCAAAIFFLAGVSIWVFVSAGALAVAMVPIAWQFLHDYQKRRVMTFFNPENDPLGAGYHITQSKIALGSGGITGKGFLQGTQSHLNFLPEKQTDFIFTLFAEEWGLMGALGLLGLFALIIFYCMAIALSSQNQFGRLLALGLTINFAIYIFINIGMVMGLLPVVGVPLPLISNGGSVMMSVLFGFGLILSVYVHRDVKFSRRGKDID